MVYQDSHLILCSYHASFIPLKTTFGLNIVLTIKIDEDHAMVCRLHFRCIFAHVLNLQKMHLTYCLGYLLVKKRENYSNSPIVQVIFMIKLCNCCPLQNNKLTSRPS